VSEVSQGEGWWQASDGKWYAPELHPDRAAMPDPTVESAAAPGGPDPTVPVAPFGADPTLASPVMPSAPPPGMPPPGAPPITTFGTPPPTAGGGGGKGKLIAAIAVVVALIAGGIAFALTRDSDSKTSTRSDASSDSSSSTKSSSKSSSSKSSSSKSSSSKSSSSSSSSSGDTAALLAKAKKALLTPADVSGGFVKTTPPTSTAPLPCTGKTPDDAATPAGKESTELDVGSDIGIFENIRVYKSVTDAKKVFTATRDGFECSSSADGSVTITGRPTAVGVTGGDDDFTIDADVVSSGSATGNLHDNPSQLPATTSDPLGSSGSDTFKVRYFMVRVGQTILSFNYISRASADTSGLDDPQTITETGVDKFVN